MIEDRGRAARGSCARHWRRERRGSRKGHRNLAPIFGSQLPLALFSGNAFADN